MTGGGANGPRCVKEVLDQSQAKLLSEETMLVDVSSQSPQLKEKAAVKRSNTFRLSFKNGSINQLTEIDLQG